MRSLLDIRKALAPPVGTPVEFANMCHKGEIAENLRVTCTPSRIKEGLRSDSIPIPATQDREGYHGDRHFTYWLSGLHDYHRVMEAVGQLPLNAQIVDFGGASGRVARFFSTLRPESKTIVADLNINHVDYITRYFPANTRALKLSGQPQIMLPDASCDLVYAFSVFTHIDVYEQSWLAEIRRILKPGGYAYLTIHAESMWLNIEKYFAFVPLKENALFQSLYKPGEPMPQERLVFEYCDTTNEYNCNVYHHTDYIRREWAKWLDVADILDGIHYGQSAVVLRKEM